MNEDKLYLQSDLKVATIAAKLNTNERYVSDAIKRGKGCSFTQFVNRYRVDFAQDLLRDDPEMKIAQVTFTSGFSSESSLFRTFKSVTGLTPKEWIVMQKSQENGS